MKRYNFVLSIICMSALTSLHAQDRVDLFTETPSVTQIYSEGRRILRSLQRYKKFTASHIAELDTLLKAGNKVSKAQELRALGDHLIRYRKLANICEANFFDETKFFLTETMLLQRKKLVRELIKTHYDILLRRNFYAELPRQQKHIVEHEYHESMQKLAEKIQKIQEELGPLEKILCADDRTFHEKHSAFALGSFVGVTSLYLLKMVCDYIASSYSKKA